MSLLETILSLKKFPFKKAFSDLQKLSALGQEAQHKWIEARKWEIAAYHFNHNNFYREKLGHVLPSRWTDISPITKKDLQKPLEEMISNQYNINDLYVSNTSGSSGHPFFFAKDKYAHARTWALIKFLYQQHDIDFNSKQARFYGIPLDKFGYYKEKLKDFLAGRSRFPVFDLSDANLEKYLQKFYNSKFDYVYGYTNSIVLFAKYLLQKGELLKNICPSLKICIVTSEMCTDQDRELIEKAFGIPVIKEYGASELDVIAFETSRDHWLVSEQNLFMEVVDEHNHPLPFGNEGKILVTSLFNKAMPFIRYEIGDMGSLAIDPHTGKTELSSLTGRVNDTVILPSGKKSAGLTFYYISRSILEGSGVLKEFIIKQVALDHFVFEVVTDRELSKEEHNEIQNKMDIYLEPGLKLTIKRVDQIERSASGKIKHFYSLIN